jgi:hypothetical protein
MATNFPTSLDNLTNPAGSDPVNNPSHASQHANLNDAIENLEAKVGVNNSAVTTSLDYRVKQLETNPTYTNEEARDAIALALRTNGGITVSSDDIANTITLSTDSTIATKTYVDTAVTNLGSTAASTYVPVTEVGQADGIATLDLSGQVPFSQLGNIVNSAPATLDTLNELATALGNDANFATTTATAIGNKVSKAGGDTITSSLPGVIGLSVQGAASQTANLQEWKNSAGTNQASISATGSITGVSFIAGNLNMSNNNASLVTNSGVSIRNTDGTTVPFAIRAGDTTQTGNLLQISAYNNAATLPAYVPVFRINGTGQVEGNNPTTVPLVVKQSTTTFSVFATTSGNPSAGKVRYQYINSYNYFAVGQTVTISGLTPSGYNGTFTIETVGLVSGSAYYFTVANATTGGATGTGLISPAYPADIQQWQNSAGTVLSRISAGGSMFFGTAPVVTRISAPSGDIFVSPTGPAITPIVARGFASQSADIQQWQDSTGTMLSRVDSVGAMFTITPAANTNTTQVATTAYVQTELADLVNSAPATLDTLNELATALGNDASFSTTVTNSIALKAPLASPALTGTPTAPTATAGTNTTQLATTAFVKAELSTSIQPGALYQTSAPSSPAVGQIWIDSDEDVTTFDSNILRRKAITATAGQTVFTADLPFIDGFEQIFMNGLLLVKTTDYATSGGNTVTLTSGAAVSDVIEIVSVTGANSIETYTQAETNALLAANTSVAPLSISANTTLVAKKRYFVTSASALTLTLPASPALNDEIQILDASGNSSTYNITVARNANKINGGNNNLIIDTNGGWYTLLYTGSTYGWKVG